MMNTYLSHNMLRTVRLMCSNKHKLIARYVSCQPTDHCDPATEITILPNGLRVATECQPTGLACMTLFVEAGSRFETSRNNGITHFIEHMAYKGFFDTSQQQLEKSLLLMGAKATAKTSREVQTFSVNFFPGNTADVVDILSRVICQLEVNNCAIEAAKYEISMEITDEENDPKATTFDYLHQTAFQSTPLSQRVIGPSKNIRQFERDSVLKFLHNHYQPYKLCLATAGDVRHKDIVNCAETKFGKLVGDPIHQSNDGPSRYTGSQIIYRDDSMPFAHVAIAVEAPGFTSPEYFPLLVASNVIGKWHRSQGFGEANASLLARAAAVDGICENFESFYIAYRDIGLWGVYFVSHKMGLEDMVERIQNQWMNLCTTLQNAELERALNATKLDLARNVSGVMKSSLDIGTQLMYLCTRKSLANKFDELAKIKVSGLRAIAERILYDRCPAVAAIGPTENLPDYTRIRAGQYWLRL